MIATTKAKLDELLGIHAELVEMRLGPAMNVWFPAEMRVRQAEERYRTLYLEITGELPEGGAS